MYYLGIAIYVVLLIISKIMKSEIIFVDFFLKIVRYFIHASPYSCIPVR